MCQSTSHISSQLMLASPTWNVLDNVRVLRRAAPEKVPRLILLEYH